MRIFYNNWGWIIQAESSLNYHWKFSLVIAASVFEISCGKQTDKEPWKPYPHPTAVGVGKYKITGLRCRYIKPVKHAIQRDELRRKTWQAFGALCSLEEKKNSGNEMVRCINDALGRDNFAGGGRRSRLHRQHRRASAAGGWLLHCESACFHGAWPMIWRIRPRCFIETYNQPCNGRRGDGSWRTAACDIRPSASAATLLAVGLRDARCLYHPRPPPLSTQPSIIAQW